MAEILLRSTEDVSAARKEIMQRLKSTLVERLSLKKITPDQITDDMALFGIGLGLDSVDALEVAVAVEVEFGVAVADEDVAGFRSVNSIADFIMSKRSDAGLAKQAAAS